ncbi:hypothetical protein [Eisenbergiella tayi]|uniref:hypothetical protein n=1 Tax=Eisenbergiella tayi TaxID=1432052 RepID=UPI000848455D|nr:hypothetical protein [Eisenbergiella tayi]ODR34972.1 hypothetical protein BEI60_17930 [Eisenbergiella tayi]
MFDVVWILEMLCTVTLLCITSYTLYQRGMIISVRWCAYYIFVIFFIIPNMILLLNIPLNIRSYGYQYIAREWQIEIIYTVFIIWCSESLRRAACRFERKAVFSIANIVNYELRIPLFVLVFAFIGTLLPLISALLSPEPVLYFLTFAPFSRTTELNISQSAVEYHSVFMNWATRIGMISVILLWLKLQKSSAYNRLIGGIYLYCTAIEIMFFTSKRTLGTMLLLVMMVIGILYNYRKALRSGILFGGTAVLYFVLYQSIVQKTVGGGVSTIVEIYIIYFSRTLDFRYVSFSLLHPERVQILQYPCQSFLFDILPFIRRSMWPNKPYPFGVYYTSAWNNQPVASVTYRYTVSWFAEALANLSWIGLPIGIFLYGKMLDLFEKFKHLFVRVFSIYVAVYFMVTHVQSNYVSIGILMLLYFVFERKKEVNNKGE